MVKVSIECNPYRLENVMLVNGKTPRSDSILAGYENRRLQEWVEQLPENLLKEYNDTEIEISFHGTEIDYDDLCASIKQFNQKVSGANITSSYIQAKPFGEKENVIKDIFAQLQKGPFDEFKSEDVANAFNKALNSDLEVNVVATMSSGKSTLINALLQKKLMPAKNEACTATISRITDNDDDNFTAVAYDSQKNIVSRYSNLTYENMDQLNSNSAVSEIEINGNIPFVTADEIRLVMIDTPGPNNARNEEHGKTTALALSRSSKMLVLFIMNATNLQTNDQDTFLERIARSMSVGGKQSKDRFIFVVNKMDTFGEGDSVEESLRNVREYLESKGIKDPNIFPASANTALQIRRLLNNDPTLVNDSKTKRKIDNMAYDLIDEDMLHLQKYAVLPPSCKGIIDTELHTAQQNDDIYGQALVYSGIRPIEEIIRMYVTKYARPAKIKNVVDTFRKKIEDADTFVKLQNEIATNKDKQQEIRKQIELIETTLNNKEENEKFKETINKLNLNDKVENDIKTISVRTTGKFNKFFEKYPNELDEDDAEELILRFNRLAKDTFDDYSVEVQNILDNDIKEKGNRLLAEYVERIKELSNAISREGIKFDLLDLVSDKISELSDMENVIDRSRDIKTVYDEQEKTRTETRTRSVKNENKKWYKPWTWFDPKYVDEDYDVEVTYMETVERKVEYVRKDKIMYITLQKVEAQLLEDQKAVAEYSKQQTETIKRYFNAQFEKVNQYIEEKANELKCCFADDKNIENKIIEIQNNTKWLNDIKCKLESILDI